MNKQTFSIPEGCKAVTVEQVGNKIITTFEPQFKRGDVLINDNKDIFVLDKIDENYASEMVGFLNNGCLTFGNGGIFDFIHGYRHSTSEEAQPLWDALAKEGKLWNPETMQVEEIKKEIPRAKKGGTYWCFVNRFSILDFTENGDKGDDAQYDSGNYFLSEEQIQRAADKLKSALDEFWKEELK